MNRLNKLLELSTNESIILYNLESNKSRTLRQVGQMAMDETNETRACTYLGIVMACLGWEEGKKKSNFAHSSPKL